MHALHMQERIKRLGIKRYNGVPRQSIVGWIRYIWTTTIVEQGLNVAMIHM
jgi:hypothetical protein